MKVVTQNFIGTTEEWKTANPKLYNAVWGFEITEDKKILAKLGNGKDFWNDLKYFDIENIEGLPEKLQNLQAVIDAEVQARKESDTTLQDNINAEARERQQADTTLQDNINAEARERQQADTALQDNINAEAQERERGDANLQKQIEALMPEGLKELTGFIMNLPEELQNMQSAANAETATRTGADTTLQNNIDAEKRKRLSADKNLQGQLDGVQTVQLNGALLTRVINGSTDVAKNLFDPSTVFEAGKTLVNDTNGTLGVYTGDTDSATINVETKTVSPIAANEPTLLGNVANFADLPLTVDNAVNSLNWNTPRVDDYARVLADETNDNKTVEWYITDITDGDITWGNPVIINTADYQGQTAAEDSGRVLTGGAAAGTFGQSLGIDIEPTNNSTNLISSHAVYALIQQAISNIFLASHPVDSIYITVSPDEDTAAKMHDKYGGTWEAWGSGKVPVGVNTQETEFNTVEKTGGAKTHTLSVAEMPSHTHDIPTALAAATLGFAGSGTYGSGVGSTVTNAKGGGNSHNNLQPYITCYMWKRKE